jgi:translation elongation factor EF-1alpha
MVFIGHYDDGQSTVCGNLKYMIDIVGARIMEKWKKKEKRLFEAFGGPSERQFRRLLSLLEIAET